MAIELISTVVPKNGQGFAIALANDIQGGLHSVNSVQERDSISVERLSEGMLCYVKNEGMFQYINGTWVTFASSSSFVVDTNEDMLALDTSQLTFGTICYVIESGIFYYSTNGWVSFGISDSQNGTTCFHIGSSPPKNTSLIWIDTSIESLDTSIESVVLDEFRAIFESMKSTIRELHLEIAENKNLISGLSSSNSILKTTVQDLEKRIYNLEHNVVIKPDDGVTDESSTLSILTEDGIALLCEDGTFLLMDTEEDVILTNALLTEMDNRF